MVGCFLGGVGDAGKLASEDVGELREDMS